MLNYDKDSNYNFVIKKGEKYYTGIENIKNAVNFINALIFGCDYGCLKDDKEAAIIFDDGSWVTSENDLLTFWKLSHVDER